MSYPNNRFTAYQETMINTASPTKLVVLLYQGAIRFLRQGIDDIGKKNMVGKAQSIGKAVAIIQHLQATLDLKNGQVIAADLDRLYIYAMDKILEGSTTLRAAPIEEAIKVLSTLLSGWEEISKGSSKGESETNVPAGVLASQAATGHFNLHA